MVDFYQYNDQLKISKKKGVTYVYDPIRKKNIILQPEEIIRQLTLVHLTKTLGFNPNYINVEKQIKYNSLVKRFDIIVYDKDIKPYLIVECKAPNVKVDQSTFDQVSQYNYVIKAPYIMVTNGETTLYAQVHSELRKYEFIEEIHPSSKESDL